MGIDISLTVLWYLDELQTASCKIIMSSKQGRQQETVRHQAQSIATRVAMVAENGMLW